MAESLRTRMERWGFNLFPAFRRTGARLTYIAADWHEVRLKLPLSWRTRNYVGTIFGGSMYAAADPIYMVMLIKVLGPDYVVWCKAASIRFRRPGRGTLHARFVLDPATLDEIRRETENGGSVDRILSVELTNGGGEVCASIDETLYIKRR
jgi:acyl-coenzyme A thioesterase PaaI-like protein